MKLELINRKKIRADNYITIFMVLIYLLFDLFSLLYAIISVVVYPLVALVTDGVIKIINGFNKVKHDNSIKLNRILLGIIYVIFGISFLNFLLIQPNITPNIIFTLIAFPMMIVGIAGITKGISIDLYSEKYRVVNILVGVFTLIIIFLAFASPEENYVIYSITLIAFLIFNILSRAALYISEFGLSLVHIKNFKLFFYIISDHLINIDANDDLVLSKMK